MALKNPFQLLEGDQENIDHRVEEGIYNEKVYVQTKSCLVTRNDGRTGEFLIEDSDLEESDIMNFVVCDYQGKYGGREDLEILLDGTTPSSTVEKFIETNKDSLTGISHDSNGYYAITHERVLDIYNLVLQQQVLKQQIKHGQHQTNTPDSAYQYFNG